MSFIGDITKKNISFSFFLNNSRRGSSSFLLMYNNNNNNNNNNLLYYNRIQTATNDNINNKLTRRTALHIIQHK